jgi:hypothetical protein
MRQHLLVTLIFAPAAALAAQSGFLPSQSPYRPIENGRYFELSAGRVYGGGGFLQLGPRNGTSEGIRFVIRGKNTLQFSFGAWVAGTERTVIDADDSVATRNKGLFDQRLIAGDISIQLNLTGGKTWHGLAPLAAVTFGLVHGERSPAIDTSGYRFGNKIFFAPTIGTRWFVGQRLYLRLDARALIWKLTYPPSYSDEPAKQPGTATNSNAVNTRGLSGQYTLTPEIRLGLGIAW